MTVTRQYLLELVGRQSGDAKHELAATSTLDVIWTLYADVLSLTPDRVDDPDRDRFYLSKGHGPQAYYAVLAAYGYLDVSVLPMYRQFDSPLGLHPDRSRVNAVEISSGSLGHGLPLALGTALALRRQQRTARTFVLLGDQELGEGSNHEAIAVAARMGLTHLTAIVIDNSTPPQWPGGIASRFAVEGWHTADVDGRDRTTIAEALRPVHEQPGVVVARVGDGS